MKIDDKYKTLVNKILKKGNRTDDISRDTYNIKIFGEQIEYEFKDGSFPILTTKKIFYKSIIRELLWFLKGKTNIHSLITDGVKIWNDDAYNYYKMKVKSYHKIHGIDNELLKIINDEHSLVIEDRYIDKDSFLERCKVDTLMYSELGYTFGDLGKVYGKQWRDFGGVDQIKDLLYRIATDKYNRRLLCSAWNPSELSDVALPPCHLLIQADIHTKKGKDYLNLMWYQRSVDTFLGLPFNISSYGFLLCIFAEIFGLERGKLVGSLGNVHIYSTHIDAINKQMDNDTSAYLEPNLSFSDKAKSVFNTIREDIETNVLDSASLTHYFNILDVDDFILENYQSFESISAKMLAPIV